MNDNDMAEKKLDFKFIYFLMTVITTFSVSSSIFSTFDFSFSYVLVFFLSLLFCSLSFVIFRNIKVGIVLFTIIVIGITGFALCTYFIKDLGYYVPMGDSFAWFMQFLFNNEPIHVNAEAYVQIISTFIIAFAAITFYFVLYKKGLFYVTIAISLTIFAFQTAAYYTRGIIWNTDFDFPFFIFVFSCILFYFLYEYKRRKNKKNDGYAAPGKYLRLTIIISIVIFLFVYFIPKPSKSIEVSKSFDDKMFQMRDDISNFMRRNILLDNSKFDLSSTGYNNDPKQLGGPITVDNHVALKVKTSDLVYLRGTVKDDYTGNIWRNIEKKEFEYDDDLNPIKIDVLEKVFSKALIDNKKSNPDSMWNLKNVNIKYQRIVTRSVFYPLKTYKIDYIIPDEFYTKVSVDSTLLSSWACPSTFQYNISSYDINYNYPETLKALRKSYKGLYGDIKSTPDGIDLAQLNILKENADKIYKKYAQIPRTMPSRVMELALKVTEEKNNNFDKVKAIESFLAFNYVYNTNPPKVPAKRDFVDYFLFENKQGYCTYYASAMAMMVRSIGLPARYVEGFYALATNAEDEFTEVQNNDGHSWVEVYFEGIGWIAFEPTSDQYENFYSSVGDNVKDQFREDFSEALDNEYSPLQKPISDSKDIKDVTAEPVIVKKPNPSSTPNSTLYAATRIPSTPVTTPSSGNGPDSAANPRITGVPLPNSENTSDKSNNLAVIIYVLLFLAVIGAWILFNYQRKYRLMSRINHMNNNDAVVTLFSYYAKVFKKMGHELKNDETALEFMMRLMNQGIYKDLPLEKVFDIFMKARYANSYVSELELRFMVNFYDDLIVVAKRYIGTFTFYIYRMFLGQI